MDYIKRTADIVVTIGDSKKIYAEDVMRSYTIVKEVNDYLSTLEVYEKCQDKRNDFTKKMNEQKDLNKRLLYTYYAVLQRIADSPSTLHIAGSIFIGIPTLYSFMNEYIKSNPSYQIATA